MAESELPEDVLAVFLSYSRRDLDEAEQFAAALRSRGFRVLRDLDDILPTEDWKLRLSNLIEECDAVVFLLSPQSASSEICRWEVEYASSLGKKIAPVVVKDIDGSEIPQTLSRLNYIFATQQDRLLNAVESLCDAFSGTAEWAREYRKILLQALEWERAGFPQSGLLGGRKFDAALGHLLRRPSELPEPTEVVTRFVEQSRAHAGKVSEYNRLKLEGIGNLLEPAIEARIQAIYKQLNEQAFGPTHMMPETFGVYEQEEVADLRNFAQVNSRWHPQPAEQVEQYVDGHGFNAVRYRFPCCGLTVSSSSNTTTFRQLSAKGCENNPSPDQQL